MGVLMACLGNLYILCFIDNLEIGANMVFYDVLI